MLELLRISRGRFGRQFQGLWARDCVPERGDHMSKKKLRVVMAGNRESVTERLIGYLREIRGYKDGLYSYIN